MRITTIPFSTLKRSKKAGSQHKYWDDRLFEKIKMLYMNLMLKFF